MDQTTLPQISPSLIPENKSSMITKKKLLVISVFFLVIIVGLTWYFYKGFRSNNTNEVNLFGLSSNDFSGNIEKINDQSLTVTDTQYLPEGQPKKFTFKVHVSDQTDIKWEPLSISYSFKIATHSAEQAKLADLKIGQRVHILVKDIRKNGRGELMADSITISRGLVTINGTINSFQNNTLVVRAKPPSVAEEKDYQFKLDNEIEITSFTDQRKLSLTDLKKDLAVIIYADKDIDTFTDLTALKISVIEKIR